MNSETYHVRFRGVTSGPFTRQQLILMAQAGVVSKYHEITTDGVTWQTARSLDWLLAAPRSGLLTTPPSGAPPIPSGAGLAPPAAATPNTELACLTRPPLVQAAAHASPSSGPVPPPVPLVGTSPPVFPASSGAGSSFGRWLALAILGGALLIGLAIFLRPSGPARPAIPSAEAEPTATAIRLSLTDATALPIEASPSPPFTPLSSAASPAIIPAPASPTPNAPLAARQNPPMPAATAAVLAPTVPPAPLPARPPKPARPAAAVPAQNKLPSDAEVDQLVKDLQDDLLQLQEANGLWDADYEKTLPNRDAGDTDMAMWALVASGCDRKDPRMKKALDAYLQTDMPPWTYRLGFRFNTWSHLVRWSSDPKIVAACRKLLEKEGPHLVNSIGPDATYTYLTLSGMPRRKLSAAEPMPTAVPQKTGPFAPQGRAGGDNSNTQYGVYGVWALADAKIEVPPAYWHLADKGWQDMQFPDSGWSYHGARETGNRLLNLNIGSYLTMTDAGLNTLYVVIDKLWSQGADGQYQFLKGFHYTAAAAAGMKKTLAAVNRGWQWYQKAGGGALGGLMGMGGEGYTQFGMQRLGVASGRKYIGGRNWLEEIVADSNGLKIGRAGRKLLRRKNPAGAGGTQNLAWELMNLAFGRAPVLFSKLEHGADELDWNYYPRDVANLTQWAAYELDRYLNWQIIGTKDELFDLQDAPILIITGSGKLDLPEDFQAKLKKYCALGGTVFLHPNLHSDAFCQSAKNLFTRIYADEKYAFARLPPEHPLYTGGVTGVKLDPGKIAAIPLWGMNDGGRDFVILCDGDIAGAWQLRLNATYPEVFRLMMNLKDYAAPPDFRDLPSRLRPKPAPLPAGLSVLKVARLKHAGQSAANPALYEALAPALAEKGLRLDVQTEVTPALPDLLTADVIHVTGHQAYSFSPPEGAAIQAALRAGAFLLVDPAYGHPESIKSNQALVKQLGLTTRPLDPAKDPLLAGPAKLQLNNWAQKQFDTAFQELLLDGKPVGLLCEVDITAAATGHNVSAYPGVNIPFARQLWANLAAAAYDRAGGAAPNN